MNPLLPTLRLATGGTFPTAASFGLSRWLRLRRERPVAPEDSLASRAAFFKAGERLIARAADKGQQTSVVVFEQADLPELQAVFGTAVARKLAARIQQKLMAVAGSHGVAVRTDPTTWTVLIPGSDRQATLAAIRRTLGPSFSIELNTEDDEVILVPDFVIQVADGKRSLEQMYGESRQKIKRAHEHEQRRQHYLRREHESHCTVRLSLPPV